MGIFLWFGLRFGSRDFFFVKCAVHIVIYPWSRTSEMLEMQVSRERRGHCPCDGAVFRTTVISIQRLTVRISDMRRQILAQTGTQRRSRAMRMATKPQTDSVTGRERVCVVCLHLICALCTKYISTSGAAPLHTTRHVLEDYHACHHCIMSSLWILVASTIADTHSIVVSAPRGFLHKVRSHCMFRVDVGSSLQLK